jgi:hypothetical protein
VRNDALVVGMGTRAGKIAGVVQQLPSQAQPLSVRLASRHHALLRHGHQPRRASSSAAFTVRSAIRA